jgi:hypothetical protein
VKVTLYAGLRLAACGAPVPCVRAWMHRLRALNLWRALVWGRVEAVLKAVAKHTALTLSRARAKGVLHLPDIVTWGRRGSRCDRA